MTTAAPTLKLTRPSAVEAIVDQLAPAMGRAFVGAAVSAQRKIDVEVLAANIEAGRFLQIVEQLKMEQFVAEDLAPLTDFMVVANERGRKLAERFILEKAKKPKVTIEQITESANRLLRQHDRIKEHPGRMPFPSISASSSYERQLEELYAGIKDHIKQFPFTDEWRFEVKAIEQRLVRALQALNERNFDTALSNLHSATAELVTSVPSNRYALFAEPKPLKTPRALFGFDFKTANPKALLAAERQAAELLTSVNAETKQTVRNLIARSYREGITSRDTARMIRDVVGLNDRQATALFNYRSGLVEEGIKPDRVIALTERYGNRLLRQRADTIAQTEIHRASAEGQHELWREAVREGHLGADALRIWIANSGACSWCEAMELLNEDGVSIDGQFVTPDGDMIDGPEDSHVGCKCSTGLRQ